MAYQASSILRGDSLAQAQLAYSQGRHHEAERLCKAILAQAPAHIAAMQLLVMIRREQGALVEAERLLLQLEALVPESPEIRYELAILRHCQGRIGEAQRLLRQVIERRPDHAFAQMVLGRIYDGQGLLSQAEFHLRYAHQLRPNDETICRDLGSIIEREGQKETAEHFFRIAYALNPDSIETLLEWATMEEGRNRLERAAELIEHAMLRRPDDPRCHLLHGMVLRRQGKLDAALKALERAGSSELSPPLQENWRRERASVLDRMGRYAEAFADYSRAARIAREALGLGYREQENRELFERQSAFFRHERMAGLPRARAESATEAQPIFIVGFPRSGTTLVEQILSSHPHIVAGDELHALMQLVAETPERLQSKLPYPDCLEVLRTPDGGQAGVQLLRRNYLQKVRRRGVMEPGVGRFTDKTPLNETHLGFIHLLFPEAPLVHMIRHPLDVVLSSFINGVRHGDNFASSLLDTARHYAMTMELVEQYRAELKLNYLPVRYETLVAEPEATIRQLLEFVGEPWHPACLEFHRNARQARTASYAQVKEKLYTRSLYRYRNYLPSLTEIIPVLQPHIERLGYTLDEEVES